jgi:hypothetical protein
VQTAANSSTWLRTITFMAAEVYTKGVFKPAAARALFAVPTISHDGSRSYDVTSDGLRFLVKTLWRQIPPPPINVVVNWGAALQ